MLGPSNLWRNRKKAKLYDNRRSAFRPVYFSFFHRLENENHRLAHNTFPRSGPLIWPEISLQGTLDPIKHTKRVLCIPSSAHKWRNVKAQKHLPPPPFPLRTPHYNQGRYGGLGWFLHRLKYRNVRNTLPDSFSLTLRSISFPKRSNRVAPAVVISVASCLEYFRSCI